jgi:hypothetical protein
MKVIVEGNKSCHPPSAGDCAAGKYQYEAPMKSDSEVH